MDLRNIENKAPLIKDFFTWLLDDTNIILESELDFTLAPSYMDANIYYPKQIADFFNSRAMQRLGRISQLDLVIDEFPNTYHNRLEHSKGVYYIKLEEMLYNFQNNSWRKNIENKKMKIYLLAELFKVAGHDIGHLPLSHALETTIFGFHGPHEIIGQRIMLEDFEIQSLLSSINPDLPNALQDLYKKNILNFNLHDESNYDVDRLDYINRDNLYAGNNISMPYLHYESIHVYSDDMIHPKRDIDGSIIPCSDSNFTIDVYDYTSLRNIEQFLQIRENGYKTIYFSPKTYIREHCLESLFRLFLQSNSKVGNELKEYLNSLTRSNIDNIDLSLYVGWDDIKFYAQILEIAENHEDENIRSLATMTIPNLKNFLTMLYSHLKMYSKTRVYSEEDKKFLKKLKLIIKDNSTLSQNLKDVNYTMNNILYFDESLQLPVSYKKYIDENLINSCSISINAYDSNTPIYIIDKHKKIYELSLHPEKSCDWNNRISSNTYAYAFVPCLKSHNISDAEIEDMRQYCKPQVQNQQQKPLNVNMQPLQVGHKIEDCFLEL